MRLLHSADWHLGRTLLGTDLVPDQRHALEGLVALAGEERPDAVVIAGDVYDRPVPHPDAVALLDETLQALAGDLRIPVVLIAGNHDNPVRLGFGSGLLAPAGLMIAGPPTADPPSLALATRSGPWRVWALPYADPVQVASLAVDPGLRGHQAAMGHMLDRIRAAFRPGERNVLVAHAWVTGGEPSESERPLTVGGTGEVPASLFAGFDYVALGHLHRPQTLGGGPIRYAGSLLPYSLSETGHAKSVTLVDLSGPVPEIRESALPVRRRFRGVQGALADLLRSEPSDDYIWAAYTDATPQHAPAERLRAIWPHLLQVVRAPGGAVTPAGEPAVAAAQVRALGLAELFRSFVGATVSGELTPAQSAALDTLVADYERRLREG